MPIIVEVGGGGAQAYAFILVTYPSGSTITCTNTSGSKAISTTKQLFYVKTGATSCVVSCTNGTQTSSQTVTITGEGTGYQITLTYATYIMTNGVIQSGYTFAAAGEHGSVSQQSGYYQIHVSNTAFDTTYYETFTSSQVSLSNKSTIHARGYFRNTSGSSTFTIQALDSNKNILGSASFGTSNAWRTIDISSYASSVAYLRFSASAISTNLGAETYGYAYDLYAD